MKLKDNFLSSGLFKRVQGELSSSMMIILLLLFSPLVISAAEIVAVQSMNIKPYNDAFLGFQNRCNCTPARIIVSESQGVDIVKKIHSEKPNVIIAIGMEALKRVKTMNDTPIVYLMVLNPSSLLSKSDNITGVSLNIAPDIQLAAVKHALPDMTNIGVIYDPARTAPFVQRASAAAPAHGINLVTREIHQSMKVPSTLNSMKEEIHAFWMLPDIMVITPETVEYLMLFSIEHRIPVITFSEKYLEMGALMSLGIDAHDIGEQAWELTHQILSGSDVKEMPDENARKINITINQVTVKKLGIKIND